jgi:signal transduction histidine kinase
MFYDMTQFREFEVNVKRLVEERTRELLKAREEAETHCATEQKLRKIIENKMKKQVNMNRMLVHELKTPLIPILGTGGILTQMITEEPYKGMIQNIMDGANALSHRIDDLLDIERSDAGLLHLNIENIDVTPLLQFTYDFYQTMAINREQQFILTVNDYLPKVWVDKERLQQILYNLLSNAFKFTPYGGKIVLSARTNRNNVIIEVKDNGKGISADIKARLFNEFPHINEPRDYCQGLGVGLIITKRLVELNNGKIWVKSIEGEGSTFSFSLPISKKDRRNITNENIIN